MASFHNFVLLLLLTATLILVTEAAQERRRAIPSEEEKKEFERQQLKAINKPAIKSFKTEQGDIFDCINIHKQLAFDHHLLKNHSVQLKPTNAPEWITSNNILWEADPLQYLQEEINCPDGTVIVKRTTMQDLMLAKRLKSIGFNGPLNFLTERNNTDVTGPYYVATVNFGPSNFYGVKGNLNLWGPQVSQDQMSGAFMAVAGGPKERFSSISVGWMVDPSLYQISQYHVHLYAYWGKDNDKSGCYDITCPGFVQVSKTIPLDLANGDWWFAYNDENVGYWPASLFLDSGFDKRANYAAWGGQVYSPVTEKAPVMGSGNWPREGLSKAAYVNSIKVITGFKKVIDPEINRLKARETSSKCYRTLYGNGDKEPWLRTLYYGGHAGCIET
ncbi:hypothetical protein DY000_02037987 [Brassica cretica]|uniref:Neprosin PEP catalytic domain-containing protein n=1 Tax=Brassica cretica TaxID=69181 RepID=A0ABQ7BEI6_BRACR|nr:hypothetical protein DY000_02037987 [Brassica cretica]